MKKTFKVLFDENFGCCFDHQEEREVGWNELLEILREYRKRKTEYKLIPREFGYDFWLVILH